ncbi:MAG: LGFP repeat-containing protein [Candidatus Binataceae bacterium]
MLRFCLRSYVTSIVWLALVGSASAFAVYGAIADKWQHLGGERGALGPALSDEADAPGGGRFNRFAYGYIYWRPQTGAFAIYGLIATKWSQLGGINGYGYPINDEAPADRGGRFNDFDRANSIYFHPSYGTRAVYGAIRAKWRSLGAERSFLGYPVTDEQPAANLGRFSAFAGGLIYWHADVGANAIYGEIGKRWLQLGAERSSCGYPTSDEADFDDGRDGSVYGYGTGKRFRRSTFMRGQILWSKARNQVYVECGKQTTMQPPPSGEACNFTAVASNNQCLNADGTPSSLPSGGTTGTGCGSDATRAQARAKLVLGQAVCLTEGNTPQPGCCTFSSKTAAGCGCR